MPKASRPQATELSDYDRKILNEYGRPQADFMESNPAEPGVPENKRHKS